MDNFDFIKNKFDTDGLKAPDSISEDVIAEKLADKPKLKLYQQPVFKKAVSIVACFVLIVGIFSIALPKAEYRYVKSGEWSDVTSTKIKTFSNYNQMVIKADEIKQAKRNYYDSLYYGGDVYDDGWDTNTASGTFNNDMIGGIGSFAETYKQVEGVDEGDIIKNDGKHIFYVNNDNEVLIYEGEKLVSKITDYVYLEDRYGYHYDNVHGSINELYINNNQLILIEVSIDDDNRTASATKTNIHIYDISDINNPKKIKTFSQNGNLPKTRMIGSQLYVISNVYTYSLENAEDYYMYTEEDGVETIISADSIHYCDGSTETDCFVISAVDTEKMKRSTDTKAFFGFGSKVYCNEKNLYIILNNYSFSNNRSTGIVKIELKTNKIKFSEAIEINGYVHSQFSLDEKDGYLRVATTDENGNNLYVFDDDFKKIGEITGIAEGELIKAVRYIGDMCYLITYEQTDPLFAIDISNPKNPVIKGSVEITGFSSQLHPIDENTIMGIGYSDNFGIKLVLFDISNAAKPKVLDTYVMDAEYARSNAQENHKAIIVNNDKDYIAIDYLCYDNYNVDTGALLFNAENNKINVLNKFQVNCVEESDNIERVTYIGDTLYAFDSNGSIYSFDM